MNEIGKNERMNGRINEWMNKSKKIKHSTRLQFKCLFKMPSLKMKQGQKQDFSAEGCTTKE